MTKFAKLSLSLLAAGVVSACQTTEPTVVDLSSVDRLSEQLNQNDQQLLAVLEQQQVQIAQLQQALISATNASSQAAAQAAVAAIAAQQVVQQPAAPITLPTGQCPENQTVIELQGKTVLGNQEWVWIDQAKSHYKARVDTGATTSSISAQDIVQLERDGKRWVKFRIAHGDETGIELELPIARYSRIRQSSADESDRRPVVELNVRVGTINTRAEFTLTDRSEMSFPVLIGREFMQDIVVVDISDSFVQPKYKPENN